MLLYLVKSIVASSSYLQLRLFCLVTFCKGLHLVKSGLLAGNQVIDKCHLLTIRMLRLGMLKSDLIHFIWMASPWQGFYPLGFHQSIGRSSRPQESVAVHQFPISYHSNFQQ